MPVPPEELRKIADYLEERIPQFAIWDTRELNGDTFYCVDFFMQPSVRLLRRQGIEVPEPSFEDIIDPDSPLDELKRAPRLETPCPKGSVPMRQITVDEIALFGSLEAYVSRPPPAIDTHEYAAVEQNVYNYGAEAKINIWNPSVESTGDFSISQLWISRGAVGGPTLETIEAGWIRRYGATQSRLFVYFTNNAYNSPGVPGNSCWNTDCGFVLTNPSNPIDVAFNAYSLYGGSQVEGHWNIQRNGPDNRWNFWYEGYNVGYWPQALFDASGLYDHADKATWGGEIYDAAGATHTATDMGAGQKPVSPDSGNYGWVGYANQLRYHPGTNTYAEASPSITAVTLTNSSCYDVKSFNNGTAWKRFIYYGGTGRSATCP